MDGLHEYHGDFDLTVTDGNRGPVLRFLRDSEIITEIHLSPTGAERLGRELLERSHASTSDRRGRVPVQGVRVS